MKIALWLEKDTWAFGRISRAIQKYSRHKVDIYQWLVPLEDFSKYDLLYSPCWFAKQIYLKHGGKTSMVTGVHGPAELFNYRTDTLKSCPTSAKHIESGRISDDLRRIFDSQRIVGCVSRELVNLLRPQVDCTLAYTPCGADVDLFYKPIQQMPLTVLVPATPEHIGATQHGYDVKRWGWAQEIQKRLPEIEFKFLTGRLTLDEMPNYYRQGNVLLCTAHSEGGPLGVLEAGMGGVVPLSTPVGVVPELVIPNFNGELFNTVDDAVKILSDWKNRSLTRMQTNIRESMLSRSWSNLIEVWDDFFEMAL